MEDFNFERVQSFRYGYPIHHYPEVASSHRSTVHFFGDEEDEDLFKLPLPTSKNGSFHYEENKKGRGEKNHDTKKQSRMCCVSSRPPKAVDEDLYKIPPESIYQMPKRKRIFGNFWSGCLGLDHL